MDTSGVVHLTDFTGSNWSMQSKSGSTSSFTLQNGNTVSRSTPSTGNVKITITKAGTLYAFGNQNRGGTSPTIKEVECGSSGGSITALYQATIYAVKFN